MHETSPVVLTTERLLLSMLTPADAGRIARYYAKNRGFHAPRNPPLGDEFYEEGFWRERIVHCHREFEQDRALRLFFLLRADPHGSLVGQCSFTGIMRGPFQACNLGYSIDQRHEGKGLMYEGLQAAIAYAFEGLQLHRLQANYLPWNERSGRVLKRLGFQIEGYARNYLFIDGAWRDHVLTSLSNPNKERP